MKSKWRQGFTLIEVMLALMIFTLLAGAVFTSVQAVSSASAVLGVEQLRARKIDAFLTWVRRGFRNLSGRSEVILRTRDSGGAGRAVELIIRRAPGAFSLGEFDANGGEVVLSAIPDGRGTATISVTRFPSSMSVSDSVKFLEKAEWLPLLEGVRTLQWTFWNPDEQKFIEEWTEGQPLPKLVHLKMGLDSGEIVEAVFRPPQLTAEVPKNKTDKNVQNPQLTPPSPPAPKR